MVSGFDQVLQTSPVMVRLSGSMSNGNQWSHMLGMLCLHPFSWLAFRFSEYWAFHIRSLILTRSVAVSPPWYLVLPQLLPSTSLSRFPRVSHRSPFNRSVTSLVFDLKTSLAPWAAISSLAISSLPRPSVSSNSALLTLDKHSIRYACSATSSPRESFSARGVGHLLCPGALPPGRPRRGRHAAPGPAAGVVRPAALTHRGRLQAASIMSSTRSQCPNSNCPSLSVTHVSFSRSLLSSSGCPLLWIFSQLPLFSQNLSLLPLQLPPSPTSVPSAIATTTAAAAADFDEDGE